MASIALNVFNKYGQPQELLVVGPWAIYESDPATGASPVATGTGPNTNAQGEWSTTYTNVGTPPEVWLYIGTSSASHTSTANAIVGYFKVPVAY
jgi:hypothetical protein